MRVLPVLAIAVIVAAAARAQTPSPAADVAAVRALVQRYMDAREARDPRAVESLFTANADQMTTSGEWRRGRPAIVSGTQDSSSRNPGARRITVESVRFVTPDVAIADGPYEIVPSGGGTARRMWATIVAVRESDGWRISAIRNMAPTGSQ